MPDPSRINYNDGSSSIPKMRKLAYYVGTKRVLFGCAIGQPASSFVLMNVNDLDSLVVTGFLS